MIRYMEIPEIEQVMKIWLECNLEVHSFMEATYWTDNYDTVKEMMENSNIYVSVEEGVIQGFAGVTEGYYLAGIFVLRDYRNKGIGKQLLDYIKTRYDELTLDVYDHNKQAQNFYKREGFVVVETHPESPVEHTMVWPETV